MANGLWFGEMPEHLQNCTFIELAAASPVRTSGMVIALEQLKVGGIAGSAQSLLRGTFTFYFQDAYSVQLQLPACDTDIVGSFTCALVGPRPTDAQLRRLLGARQDKVAELISYQQDENDHLAGSFVLARRVVLSKDNLATYPLNGSVPASILRSLIPVDDPTNSRANARSTYARGNREEEVTVDGQNGAADGNDEDCTCPFILDINAVMPTGGDHAVSARCRSERLRTLESDLRASSNSPENVSLSEQAAAAAAVEAGRPPPGGTRKAMVIPHTGRLVEDFTEPGVFVGAYYHLFPHALGGHLDKRPRKLTFTRWARILLRRRDPRFRKDRTFLFCLAALIFRREAISNARWKLTGKIPHGIAETLADITPEDLVAVADAIDRGESTASALTNRPGARHLIRSMKSVHSGASWTTFNKRSTRMLAVSYIIQMGQPLFWMTLNPADVNSPIVMKVAGFDIDVSSRLKDDMPTYCDRLRLTAGDPVACADFYHDTVAAVLTSLLRFGAPDGDGGVLGRVKAYVGMTEEQRRLTLHCHLLVWIYGFNDFNSFRELMDKTPERYADLARFFSRIIFNQVASKDDVRHALQGTDEPSSANDTSSVPVTEESSQTDGVDRPAKQCLPSAPPPECWPRRGVERSLRHDNEFIDHMQPDVAEVTTSANVHKCCFTCHKGGHEDSCRYGTYISTY